MTNRLTTVLNGRPAIFDGGYGWLLQERGLEPGVPAEDWNLTNPAGVAGLHEEYAEAGAQILTTNTFGGTGFRLAGHGLDDRAHEVNRAAAAIARDVADRHGILVAGDIGPTGELLEPLGALSYDDAVAAFSAQIAGLVDGGADLILIETMSDLEEAKAAVQAARETAPDLPIVATFSFDTNLRTMMGLSPAVAVASVEGIDAVGANCGRGPDEMLQIALQMAGAHTGDVLLVAQSNAGLPQVSGDGFAYTVGPEEMGRHAVDLRAAGIDVIGACCGSSPAHIGAMVKALA